MKSYFDEYLTYTDHASDVSREISNFLNGIYEREYDAGLNIRELSSIVSSGAGLAESGTVVKRMIERKKAFKGRMPVSSNKPDGESQ